MYVHGVAFPSTAGLGHSTDLGDMCCPFGLCPTVVSMDADTHLLWTTDVRIGQLFGLLYWSAM